MQNAMIHVSIFILVLKSYPLHADGVSNFVKKFYRRFARFFISQAFCTSLLNSYNKSLH